MERGRNYLKLNESERQSFSSSVSKPCVFISHKKEDADFARHLSDYVMERGITSILTKMIRFLQKSISLLMRLLTPSKKDWKSPLI